MHFLSSTISRIQCRGLLDSWAYLEIVYGRLSDQSGCRKRYGVKLGLDYRCWSECEYQKFAVSELTNPPRLIDWLRVGFPAYRPLAVFSTCFFSVGLGHLFLGHLYRSHEQFVSFARSSSLQTRETCECHSELFAINSQLLTMPAYESSKKWNKVKYEINFGSKCSSRRLLKQQKN